MKAWWISWYQPTIDGEGNSTEWELHSPWWISGETMEEPPRLTVCAAVLAETADAAKAQAVAAQDSPGLELEWRFVDETDTDEWSPFSDRFPWNEWMAWVPSIGKTCNCEACRAEVRS